MANKLSFKEYLESKDCLRDAVKETPKVVREYEVKKYCNFPVGLKEEKYQIKLKPRNKMFIKWLREDSTKERAIGVSFEGTTDDSVMETPSWGEEKLLKWLLKNTEQNN